MTEDSPEDPFADANSHEVPSSKPPTSEFPRAGGVKSLARALEGGALESGRPPANPFVARTPPKPGLPPKPNELASALARRLTLVGENGAEAADPRPAVPAKAAPPLPSRASANPFLGNQNGQDSTNVLNGPDSSARAAPPALPPRPGSRAVSASLSGPPSPAPSLSRSQTPMNRLSSAGSENLDVYGTASRPDSRMATPVAESSSRRASIVAATTVPTSASMNRRPPFLGAEITYKGTRSIAVFRDTLVTMGLDKVRVWNIAEASRSGQPRGVVEYGGKEYRGVTAVSFLPCSVANLARDGGRYVWIGTVSGDIFCLDTTTMKAVDRRTASSKQATVTHLDCLGGGVVLEDGSGAIFAIFDNGLLLIWGRVSTRSEAGSRLSQSDVSFQGYGAGAAFSLSNGKPRTLRFPSRRNIVTPVGVELWTTAGGGPPAAGSLSLSRVILDIYDVSEDAQRFDVKRIDVSAAAGGQMGPISAMVFCVGLDLVVTAHEDAKLVFWDRRTYSVVRIIKVESSSSRVTALSFVETDDKSGYLFCGLVNGRLIVFELHRFSHDLDVVLVKDFEAGDKSVLSLVADRSSLLAEPGPEQRHHTVQIASLSDAGTVKFWDGWLLRDRLDSALRLREHSFTATKGITAMICTWNVGASKPPDQAQQTLSGQASIDDIQGFRRLLVDGCPPEWASGELQGPDVIVFGLQEIVDLDKATQQAKSFIKGTQRSIQASQGNGNEASRYALWQDSLVRLVRESFPRTSYDLVDTTGLVGLLMCTFVRDRDHRGFRVGGVAVESVKTGIGGLHGNKGALMVRMCVDDSSIAFVNCHLAAHQEKVWERNLDCSSIANGAKFGALDPWTSPQGRWDVAAPSHGLMVGGGDGTSLLDHETVFWFGDLNYRIDLPRPVVLDAISRKDWAKLLEKDQLAAQRSSLNAATTSGPPSLLRTFDEAEIRFPPTFKFDMGSDTYDSSEKARIPAWCDRVLYRGPAVGQRTYASHPIRSSDHRPVSAAFEFKVRSVNANLRDKEAKNLVAEMWDSWAGENRRACVKALRAEIASSGGL